MEKRQAIQQMVLVQLAVSMQKNANLFILISLYKVQVDQGPHETQYIATELGKNLEHLGTGEIFLNRTLIAYALRTGIDKWDLIKLQSFCKAKTLSAGQKDN